MTYLVTPAISPELFMGIPVSFSKELNPFQLDAVATTEGPLLILAGAGSGKTRALTYRFANLILQSKCLPNEILAVTFTNKAARNMENRVFELLAKNNVSIRDRLWISTFHSTCVRILRQHIHLLEYSNSFGIYDSSDQLGMIKKVMNGMNLNDKMFAPKTFQAAINGAKLLAVSPEQFAKKSHSPMDQKISEVYKNYEAEMKRANCLDFDDLLLKTLDLFQSYPTVLEHYQNTFKYIMVDEYQDTNHVQYLLVRMLADQHQNICVVGDEDQSIYSWRGADIRNILEFEKDFSNAKVIKLEENYRSSNTIVSATSELIQNNSQRKVKKSYTNNPPGDLIVVKEENSEYEEARFVAKEIESVIRSGAVVANEVAIFYRTNAQSRVLEEQLRLVNIPYKLVGGTKFYDRMEVKDLISYLKLIVNPNDDMAIDRIINTPTRGIGKTTLTKLEELSHQRKSSMRECIDIAVNEKIFNAGTTSKLRDFSNLLNKLLESSRQVSALEAYHLVLDETKYIEYLRAQDTAEATNRIENLEELDNAIDQFQKERGDEATLQSFLEEMALVSDIDTVEDDVNSVTMMTLHVSKGLEFPYVFIVGMEEGIFPGHKALGSLDPTGIEEERRLAYVGMTRAEKRLYLTYTRERRVWGSINRNPPSRFISELPSQYLEQRVEKRPRILDNAFQMASMATSQFNPRRGHDEYSQVSTDWDDDIPTADPILKRGHRVKHPTFGVGTVYSVEGQGQDQKISILFDNQLLKKFVAKYARLERL